MNFVCLKKMREINQWDDQRGNCFWSWKKKDKLDHPQHKRTMLNMNGLDLDQNGRGKWGFLIAWLTWQIESNHNNTKRTNPPLSSLRKSNRINWWIQARWARKILQHGSRSWGFEKNRTHPHLQSVFKRVPCSYFWLPQLVILIWLWWSFHYKTNLRFDCIISDDQNSMTNLFELFKYNGDVRCLNRLKFLDLFFNQNHRLIFLIDHHPTIGLMYR